MVMEYMDGGNLFNALKAGKESVRWHHGYVRLGFLIFMPVVLLKAAEKTRRGQRAA